MLVRELYAVFDGVGGLELKLKLNESYLPGRLGLLFSPGSLL